METSKREGVADIRDALGSEDSFRSMHNDDVHSVASKDEFEDCSSPQGIVSSNGNREDDANTSSTSYDDLPPTNCCYAHDVAVEDPDVRLKSHIHMICTCTWHSSISQSFNFNARNCNVVLQILLAKAEAAKMEGNVLFKQGDFCEAVTRYNQALDLAPPQAQQRAVYHANSGACHLALENFQDCVRCCSEALLVDSTYLKALRRRMAAYEKLDELDRALSDANKIVEMDPGDSKTRHLILKWEPVVKQRQEKMKEEVLGKLKDLGNSVLGRFGMSLDNFKMDQDPESGGYSIRFQQ